MVTHNQDATQNPKERRVQMLHKASQVLTHTLRDKPSKHGTLKTSEACVPRPYRSEKLLLKGSDTWTHTPGGPGQRQRWCPDLKVKEAYLRILNHWPEGQVCYLTHVSRSLLEHSLGTETSGYHIHILPLLCSGAPGSLRRELLHTSITLILWLPTREHLLITWL